MLSGPLPETLPYLLSIKVVDLANNQFTGSINGGYCGSLTILKLSNNMLSGTLSECTCEYVDLSYNSLSGPVPITCAAFFGCAQFVFLSHNQFTGCLPQQYNSIRRLDVSYNQLSCSLTQFFSAFWTTNQINILRASNNQLNGQLSSIPFQFLEALGELDLSYNNVTGTR